MSVEHIPAAQVRELRDRILAARQRVVDASPVVPADGGDAGYWQAIFERNAAEVLAAVPSVALPPGVVVRYRFFGLQGRDLLVRPFAARADTDVDTIRRLIDWHAAPDSRAAQLGSGASQDVDLLYRHFRFPHTATGYFEYWMVMQEVWASQRWAHSHLIASAAELSQITSAPGWEVVEPVQSYELAVVVTAPTARIAALVESPLERFTIQLEQIEVGADQSLRYGAPIVVATGPRGYAA